MELYGDIISNLRAAIASAKRLRGHPVHPDTLQFWRDLLSHTRQQRRDLGGHDQSTLDGLVKALETEIAEGR